MSLTSAPTSGNESQGPTLAELNTQLEEAQAMMDGAKMGEIEAKIKALESQGNTSVINPEENPGSALRTAQKDPSTSSEEIAVLDAAASAKFDVVKAEPVAAVESSPTQKDFGTLMSEWEESSDKSMSAYSSRTGDSDPNYIAAEARYKEAGAKLREWAKENNISDLNAAMDDYQVGEFEKSIPATQISDADLIKKVESMQGQGSSLMEKKYGSRESVIADAKAVMNSGLANEEKLRLQNSISSSVESGVLGDHASKVLSNYRKSLTETKE